MIQRTFCIIKPDATARGLENEINEMITKAGFKIVASKRVNASREQFETFYAEHKGKPFFEGLVEFMTSGPIVVQVLEKENAIDFYNYYIKQAGEGWKFVEKDDMNFFKLMENPFKLCAKVDFCEDSKDSFEIELYGQAGEEIISFDEIYETIQSGEKYSRIRSLGFVEFPAQIIQYDS